MSKATATAKIRSDGTIVEVLEISLVSLTSIYGDIFVNTLLGYSRTGVECW